MAFKYFNITAYPGWLPGVSETTAGATIMSDGSNFYWSYPGSVTFGATWRYRSIFTHGYLAGGYKGSNPWRAINKTWHSTDTTYFVGDQLDRAAAYVDGSFSDYNGYVWGTSEAFLTGGSWVSSINLHNGLMRQTSGLNQRNTALADAANTSQLGGQTGVGGLGLVGSVAYNGGSTNIMGQAGYRFGGGRTDIDKLVMATEIMYTISAVTSSGGQSTAGFGGENKAWVAMSGSVRHNLTWSTDAISTWSPGVDISSDGQQKSLGTKWGHFYAGQGSNTVIGMYKVQESTGTPTTGTAVTFNKLRNYGEENFEMGQDWGYMLGQYDGQQNNHTVKHNYSTDSLTQMGAACMPKGHTGQSSGACFSAAATVTSGQAM